MNETIPALVKLKEAGKTRFIGITGLPLGIFSYVLDRVPPGTLDVVLSYCHYSVNDSSLGDLIPYLKAKGVGIINASPLSMGLLTHAGPPPWHPALPQLKVCTFILRFLTLKYSFNLNSIHITHYSFCFNLILLLKVRKTMLMFFFSIILLVFTLTDVKLA